MAGAGRGDRESGQGLPCSCWMLLAWEAALKELGCESRHLAWKVWGCLCVCVCVHMPTAPQGHQLAHRVTFSQVTACQGHLAAQLRVRDAFPCC